MPASAHLELLGGVTYNTYSLEWGPVDSGESDLPFNSGWGFYAGVQYWLNPSLAIGGQIESFTGSGRERWLLGDGQTQVSIGIDGQGTGYLATLAVPISSREELQVTPFVGAGVYQVSADLRLRAQGGGTMPGVVTAKGRLSSSFQLGGKVGVSIGKEVGPGVVLSGQIAYRLVPTFRSLQLELFGFEQDWVADRGINVSGLSGALALMYRF